MRHIKESRGLVQHFARHIVHDEGLKTADVVAAQAKLDAQDGGRSRWEVVRVIRLTNGEPPCVGDQD